MNLILFNFESNKNSQVLGFAIDWINEIAKNVNKLYVVSLRCGEFEVADNVEVYCINQDKKNKLQTVFSIWAILRRIHKKDKGITGYFVHMAHYFVPIIYPFAKFYNQRIILWYAHKSVSWTLLLANFFSNRVISSTNFGYQINTKKLKVIGQGIDTTRFNFKDSFRKNIRNIVTVGRISRVKNTHLIVESFISLNRNDLYLYVVGDTLGNEDINYLNEIKNNIPKDLEENIVFTGAVPFNKLPRIYKDMDLSINISDTGSLDKTIIEPMSMGIEVITSNISAKKIFSHLNGQGIYLLNSKNEILVVLEKALYSNQKLNRKQLRDEIIQKHSLKKLVKEIIYVIDKREL